MGCDSKHPTISNKTLKSKQKHKNTEQNEKTNQKSKCFYTHTWPCRNEMKLDSKQICG